MTSAMVDVPIASRYDETRPATAGLLASKNQTVHLLSGRYAEADLERVPAAEVVIDGAGNVILTGGAGPAVGHTIHAPLISPFGNFSKNGGSEESR